MAVASIRRSATDRRGPGKDILAGAALDDPGGMADAGSIYLFDSVHNEGAVYLYKREDVQIDIKPGSVENTINFESEGTVSVAILCSADLNAMTVNVGSVTLAVAAVDRTGGGRFKASFEDVNDDGFTDLLVHFSSSVLT